jgi:hypothetical protein
MRDSEGPRPGQFAGEVQRVLTIIRSSQGNFNRVRVSTDAAFYFGQIDIPIDFEGMICYTFC